MTNPDRPQQSLERFFSQAVSRLLGDDPCTRSKTHACAAALFGQTERAPAPIEKCAIFGIAPTVLTGSEEEPVETPITGADVVAALEKLREEQDDFFFVLPVDADPALILALSDWAKGTVLSSARL